MPDDEKPAQPTPASAIFTWQNYPWIYLVVLLAINALTYQVMFKFLGELWWIFAPILTIQAWILGIFPVIHKLKNGNEINDTFVRGRRYGALLLTSLFSINCGDNLYRILLLQQWRYYKKWEPLQSDTSIWSGVLFNSLGMLTGGAFLIWAIHQFWQNRSAK